MCRNSRQAGEFSSACRIGGDEVSWASSPFRLGRCILKRNYHNTDNDE